MKVCRLTPTAKLPQKAHSGDLGYDLFAADGCMIRPNETALISTGICIQFPAGYGAFIKDRSSIATKLNLFTVAGVIDNGYTGEIKVAIYNPTEKLKSICVGDKIAQLVLIPTVDFAIQDATEINSSDGRGNSGFGSTGT